MKRVLVEICVGTSCHLLGSQDLLQVLDQLPAEQQQAVDIRGVTCLKTCGKGPNIRLNGQLYLNMTPDRLLELLEPYWIEGEELRYVASD